MFFVVLFLNCDLVKGILEIVLYVVILLLISVGLMSCVFFGIVFRVLDIEWIILLLCIWVKFILVVEIVGREFFIGFFLEVKYIKVFTRFFVKENWLIGMLVKFSFVGFFLMFWFFCFLVLSFVLSERLGRFFLEVIRFIICFRL